MLRRISLLLSILFLHVGFLQSQGIEIKGNDITIPSNGSNTPSAIDGTYYADTPILGIRTQVFSITNLDTENDISILLITVDSGEYLVNNGIRRIRNGETNEFEIGFEPVSVGLKEAIVSIYYFANRTLSVARYNIEGNAIEESEGGNMMISQYYENGNQDYIEIKNLTDTEIKGQSYFLAVYYANDNLNRAPNNGNVINIRNFDPDEVKLFDNFNLSGNEIVVLSTSRGRNCYNDRVDMVGNQGVVWGENLSLTKGGCATEMAHVDFDQNDWIVLETSKVDLATINQNIALGTYQLGPIYWNGSNWTDGALPDLSRIAYIENYYDGVSDNIEACDLIVNAEVNFDNGGTNSLIVHRDLTINAPVTIGDKESLVMYDDAATITGNIVKKESSTYRNNQYDFTYWSSPIIDGQISTVFSGVNPGRIYLFDQSKTSTSDPSEPGYWDRWVNASGDLSPGKGYAAEGISGTVGVHDISFNGRPNNGVIYENIHFWDDSNLDNDFNLIGNPYPSAIDIETFFDANSGVLDPVVYLWTHATEVSGGDFSPNDYATYNYTGGTGTGAGTGVGDGSIPEKNIGSAQGFFVRAVSSGDAVFNNSMRLEDANNQFFKQNVKKKKNGEPEKDRIWLNLTTDQGGFNQLLLGFLEGGSAGFDMGYDAVKLAGSNSISFYSLLDDKKLAIQGLGISDEPEDISLGFDSKVGDRTLSIAIEKMEGRLKDLDIYLIDHKLLHTHDLKESAYVFDLDEEGSYKNRFSLSFKQSAVLATEEILQKDELIVFNRDDMFSVNSSKIVKRIRLYNILGKLILEQHPNESFFDFNEPESQKGSVLFMEILQDGNTRIQKKLIKY